MESSVSVTVANLVTEDVEQRALSTFPSARPLSWKRYVDDTCGSRTIVEVFHQHLNSVEDFIQFTCELQKDGHDINLKRENDETISTSVFQKRAHMDQYLQFSSHHPLSHQVFCCKNIVLQGLITIFFPGATFTKGETHL